MPIRVLLLSCNSEEKGRLDLDGELRAVRLAVTDASLSDQIELIPWVDLHTSDLGTALSHHRPHIVHFTGHGARGGRLMMNDADGQYRDVPAEEVAELLATFSEDLRLVVLNACFTDRIADALIARGIGAVVGVEGRIPDAAAIRFSGALYRALGDGESLAVAFEAARSTAALDSAGARHLRLKLGEGADASMLRLSTMERQGPLWAKVVMEPLQIVLILDVYKGFPTHEVVSLLPSERQDREVLVLSDHGTPQMDRAPEPDTFGWLAMADAVAEMVRRAQALADTAHSPVHYYIAGFAPHAAFALVGRLLSAWASQVVVFNRRKDQRWDVFDIHAQRGSLPFFDQRQGLDREVRADGRLGLFLGVHHGGPPPIPRGAIEGLLGEGDEGLAGVVSLRSSQGALSGANVASCYQELARLSGQLSSLYPRASGITLFINGPGPLALLAAMALNPTQFSSLDLTFYERPGGGERYLRVLRLPHEPTGSASLKPVARSPEEVFGDLLDGIEDLRRTLNAEHLPLPSGLQLPGVDGTRIVAELLRELQNLRLPRSPSAEGFDLTSDGQLHLGADLLRALGVCSQEECRRLGRLLILHELYHYHQGLSSLNYRGVGRAGVVLEEIDYWADAFAIQALTTWDILQSGDRGRQGCRELLQGNLRAHLRAIEAFDRMEQGARLHRLPERRLRRYLIWYLQLARADHLRSPEQLPLLLGERLFVELAPLKGAVDRRYDKVIDSATANTQLFVALRGRMLRKARMPHNFEPAALLAAVRELRGEDVLAAMRYCVAENRSLLAPWLDSFS